MLGEFRQSIKSESKFLTEQISRRIARLTTSLLLPVWWLLWICCVGNTDANSGSRLGSVVFCLFSKIPNQRNIFANTQVLGVLTSDPSELPLPPFGGLYSTPWNANIQSPTKEGVETKTIWPNHGGSFQCCVPPEKNLVVDLDEEDEDGQIIIENVQMSFADCPKAQ